MKLERWGSFVSAESCPGLIPVDWGLFKLYNKSSQNIFQWVCFPSTERGQSTTLSLYVKFIDHSTMFFSHKVAATILRHWLLGLESMTQISDFVAFCSEILNNVAAYRQKQNHNAIIVVNQPNGMSRIYHVMHVGTKKCHACNKLQRYFSNFQPHYSSVYVNQ